MAEVEECDYEIRSVTQKKSTPPHDHDDFAVQQTTQCLPLVTQCPQWRVQTSLPLVEQS